MVKREILGGRIGKFSLMIMLCFTIIFTSVGALIGTSEVANAAFGFGKGEGIAGNPYIISTPEELNAIRFYPTAHYMLGNDIDLTEFLAEGGAGYNGGSFWDPIYLFTGKLDGNGYIVSGLKINRTGNYIGFFSQPASGAEIKNIGFENVDVFGNGLFIGGLAGALVNPSTAIMNSYTTGKVSGISYVGGLVGYQRDSSIMNSYSLAEVGGASSIGGLVGYQDWGSISNSYAAGLITNSMEGGLVGASNQGTYDHSFYDKKSIAMDNGKGIAKTTTEMQTKSTFEAEGWDFFGVWYMSANEYPQLRIFVIAETPAANPPGGSIVNGSTVTISSGTAGAAIYYTTNGDEPTTSSTLYESSSPVIIDDDLTIKAIAMYTGKIDSEVMSNSYSIIRGEAPVTGSLEKGTVSGTTTLKGVTAAMEYKVNSGEYVKIDNTAVTDISINAGDKIYVRLAATELALASYAQVLTAGLVDIKPASAPTSASLAQGTNSGSAKLSGVTNVMEYSLDGEDYTSITTGNTIDNMAVNAGDSIYVRIAATVQQPASDVQVLQVGLAVIKPATAPTTVSLAPGTSSGTTKLSGVTDTMEYSLDGEEYTLITTGASVDNISVNAG
ncbi:hypothetical protein BK133_26450, partial [Paenibacillus sp. FSL H8-0548]|uniref:chitobiase/beta-hexosaminidase C-terminal domain-containing protein n=1 Tax=Paenibacillus sp. FSL H8-0548 TaxID=1920422 RepID=UPI00097A73D0